MTKLVFFCCLLLAVFNSASAANRCMQPVPAVAGALSPPAGEQNLAGFGLSRSLSAGNLILSGFGSKPTCNGCSGGGMVCVGARPRIANMQVLAWVGLAYSHELCAQPCTLYPAPSALRSRCSKGGFAAGIGLQQAPVQRFLFSFELGNSRCLPSLRMADREWEALFGIGAPPREAVHAITAPVLGSLFFAPVFP